MLADEVFMFKSAAGTLTMRASESTSRLSCEKMSAQARRRSEPTYEYKYRDNFPRPVRTVRFNIGTVRKFLPIIRSKTIRSANLNGRALLRPGKPCKYHRKTGSTAGNNLSGAVNSVYGNLINPATSHDDQLSDIVAGDFG